ncbi:MAG TPA: ABC transporter substrate-binding protein [Burkholderiaceae bacterium]|nr:ABC transporter substrate-binding protein [Burkholderiaceae bacterium]
MKIPFERFRRDMFGALAAAALLLVAGLPPAAQAQAVAPDEFIKKVSTEVLDQIRADKEIQSGNPRRISEFVDKTVMPQINFERMTSLAVGRAWREATPDQRSKLMAEFRTLLLRTYSGALGSVRDEQIRMKPFRGNANESDVIVRSEVVGSRGDPIQLDYRVEKNGNGWKIYDLNVLGVWLVETYRNQFGQEINAKGLDGLIQSLAEKNKAFDQAAKKS